MRVQSIDFLRGIAVILVLFRHQYVIELISRVGWIGVDLFFVLSGFLVSMLLFEEYNKNKTINGIRFLIRRGFKIYPGFWVMIITTVIVEFLLSVSFKDHFSFVSRGGLLFELMFLQNYFGGIWNHTWSLAIEEHFYFFLLFSLLLIYRFSKHSEKHIHLYCLSIILICNFLKISKLFIHQEYSHFKLFLPTHLRADSLIFGVVLSYNYVNNKEKFITFFNKNKKILLLFSVICLSSPFIFNVDNPELVIYMSSFGLTALYLGFGIILGLFISIPDCEEKIRKIIGSRTFEVFCKVGFYSYSIYLWHMFIQRYLYSSLEHITGIYLNATLCFLLYFMLSIALGIVFGKCVEIPFLKIREKWFPKR